MKAPFIAVDAILRKEDRVALIYRKNEPRGWALPGGFVEYGESLQEACVREVKEETGLGVEIEAINAISGELGLYDDPQRDPRKRVISVVFVCDIVSGEPVVKEETEAITFVTIREALKKELVFDHAEILKDYREWFESLESTDI